MVVVAETSISLRFFGDDLAPDVVTAVLGRPPTGAETKGEVITNVKTGRSRVARRGSWRYRVERREPGNLDGQIEELCPQRTRAGAAGAKPLTALERLRR